MTALWCVLACAAGLAVIVAYAKSWDLNDKAPSMPHGSPESEVT